MSLINDKRRIIKELNDIKETIDCGTEDEYKKIYNACSADDDILDYLEEQNYITSDDEDMVISENSDSNIENSSIRNKIYLINLIRKDDQ